MVIKSEFMEEAIAEAQYAAKRGEVPVGAVIVKDGKIIASAGNETEESNDPTAHAEMLVIKKATKNLGEARLVNCDLYVTLEPCPMCAQAISFARIKRLYYGAEDKKGGGVDNGARIFNSPSCHHKPEIYGGIYSTECEKLLKDFFKERRN